MHLARIGKGPNNRPIYKRKSLLGVHEAIAREREFARRQAQIKRKS